MGNEKKSVDLEAVGCFVGKALVETMLFLLPGVLIYGIAVFISLEWNVFEWEKIGRCLFSVISIIAGTAVLNLVYGDNLGDKMRDAFGGVAPKKTAPKKEEVESHYEAEAETETTPEPEAEETKPKEDTGFMPSDDMVDDDALDKELKDLGL